MLNIGTSYDLSKWYLSGSVNLFKQFLTFQGEDN
jgi:hypothetical protein